MQQLGEDRNTKDGNATVRRPTPYPQRSKINGGLQILPNNHCIPKMIIRKHALAKNELQLIIKPTLRHLAAIQNAERRKLRHPPVFLDTQKR